MSEHEISIHLIEEESAFVYSVRSGGRVLHCGTVPTEEPVAPGYYGGSEAMD